MTWTYIPGDEISVPLSTSGDYVISHRENYILSYRPPGKHIYVGIFNSLDEAKLAAKTHDENKK